MPRKKPEPEPKTIDVQPTKEPTVTSGDPFSGASTSLATREVAPLAVPSEGLTPEFSLGLATRRVAQFKGIVKLIASEMKPQDLFVFAPRTAKTEEEILALKAYLPLHTCQTILAWAGAIWLPDKAMIERRDSDALGEFIEYDIWVDVMTADNREVRVQGSCSTRHPFHGLAFTFWGCPACRVATTSVKDGAKWINRCATHGIVKARKLNAYRPLCDVNRGNVRKHAITNAFQKAVDNLGLAPTLRDLKSAGMDITKIPRANFGRDTGDDGDNYQPERSSNQAPQKQSGQPPAPSASQSKPASTTPASQAPSAAASPAGGPPKASIPNEQVKVFGGLQKLGKFKKRGTEQIYLKLDVNNVTYMIWDNMTRTINTQGTTRTMFELLETASKGQGTPVEFIVETTVKGDITYHTIKNVLRVGTLEWEPDGMLILRRDPPPREPEAGEYESTDEDFPAGLFGPDR